MKFRLFGIHWTQPRKKKEERGNRKEKVNLKERRRTPVKKIWSLREETASDAGEWRDERMRTFFFFFFFFFFLFRSGMHLLVEIAGFRQ